MTVFLQNSIFDISLSVKGLYVFSIKSVSLGKKIVAEVPVGRYNVRLPRRMGQHVCACGGLEARGVSSLSLRRGPARAVNARPRLDLDQERMKNGMSVSLCFVTRWCNW